MITLILILTLILSANRTMSSIEQISYQKEKTIFSRGITKYELARLFSRNISGSILSTSKRASSCFSSQIIPFDDDYAAKEAVRVTKQDITLVSIPRLIATLWLGRVALSLRHGDFVETGVYKGGTASLLIRILQHFDACKKSFWGFDSFAGLPDVTKEDKKGKLSSGRVGLYRTSEEDFFFNIKLLDAYRRPELVHITKGYFNETLPVATIKHISLLRLDGDLFLSTWDALTYLYDKVIQGGYIYIDDYDSFNGCKEAVDRFRKERNINDPMVRILEGKRKDQKMKREYEAIWWKKSSLV